MSDITKMTDAEYLRAVGMGPEARPEWWRVTKLPPEMRCDYSGPPLLDTDPAHKWHNLANVLRVLGPEMDRRGWLPEILPWEKNWEGRVWTETSIPIEYESTREIPHLALLEAFHAAHIAEGGSNDNA